MRTFVLGDIHGGFKGLLQCLQGVNFDYENDKLISLGDVCDGWSEVAEAIEELLKVKNLIYIRGNHDEWGLKGLTKNPDFFRGMWSDASNWYAHGGKATEDCYVRRPDLLEKHIQFLKDSHVYHIDEKNRLFVHAGIMPGVSMKNTPVDICLWDRNFWYNQYAGRNDGKDYFEVYIGHTPTINFKGIREPINRRNTWNMDTGAAFTGKMSIMNIDTKEIFQSEELRKLYPTELGRNKSTYYSTNPYQ